MRICKITTIPYMVFPKTKFNVEAVVGSGETIDMYLSPSAGWCSCKCYFPDITGKKQFICFYDLYGTIFILNNIDNKLNLFTIMRKEEDPNYVIDLFNKRSTTVKIVT